MVRVSSVVFLMSLVFAPSAALACDCNHFPWKPKSCKEQCGSRILAFARIEDIEEAIPLERSQLDRLMQFRSTMTEETPPEDLKYRFSPEEYDRVLESFDGLSSSALVYFVREAEKESDRRAREKN